MLILMNYGGGGGQFIYGLQQYHMQSIHKYSEIALKQNHDKFWTLYIASTCKKFMFQSLKLPLLSGGTGKDQTYSGGPIKKG
jgi:hypothetical protein